jgi:hypothetical protein
VNKDIAALNPNFWGAESVMMGLNEGERANFEDIFERFSGVLRRDETISSRSAGWPVRT